MKPNKKTVSSSIKTQPEEEFDLKNSIFILGDLQRQLSHLKELNKTLEEDWATTLDEKEKAENLSKERANKIEQLERTVTSLKDESQEQISSLVGSEAERCEAAKEIRWLKMELEVAQDATKKLEGDIEDLKQKNRRDRREASSRDKEQKTNMQDLLKRIENLEGRLDERTRELFKANASIEDLKLNNEELLKQIATLKRSRNALRKLESSLKDVRDQALNENAEA